MSGAGFMTQGGGSQHDDLGNNNFEKSSRHLLIKQLSQFGDSQPFMCDGAPVKNILLVGIITSVEPKNNRVVCEVTDGTGETRISMFLSNTDAPPPDIKHGQYAQLSVTARTFVDKLQLTASNIVQPIPYSQVVAHELTALREHLHFTGKKPFPGVEATKVAKQEEAKEDSQYQEQNAFDPYGDTYEQREILLKTLDNDEGQTIDALSRTFKCDPDHMESLLRQLRDAGSVWENAGIYIKTD